MFRLIHLDYYATFGALRSKRVYLEQNSYSKGQQALCNIALTIREQINFLWNFYVTACAVLLGWMFSSKVTWSKEKGSITKVLFIAFALVNLSALYNEYQMLGLVLEDLQRFDQNGAFIAEFSQADGLGATMAAFIHLCGDAAILWLLKKRMESVSSIED